LFLTFSSWAQEEPSDSTKVIKQYIITKYNGQEIIGEILSDDGREMLVLSKNIGKIYINKSDVKNIKEITKDVVIVDGQYQPHGPFTTRYAFTTNALPIKKGENYSMINLYGPEVHFAVTNNLNIGIMTTWIASPLILAMKYSFSKEDAPVKVALGTMMGTTGYLNQFRGYGGLHWLSATIGDRAKNLTISAGYSYLFTGNENLNTQAGPFSTYSSVEITKRGIISGPIISLAGIIKVGAKANFVFDSMLGQYSQDRTEKSTHYEFNSVTGEGKNIITYNNVTKTTTAFFLMPGMRFQWTDNKAFQFTVTGISLFGDNQGSFPFPMLSWFRKF
jgi:hypothetical protein